MIIGITGSIGTGKSTVTDYLKRKGYLVLDADILAREELNKENVICEVVQRFGDSILKDGLIDRKRLGEIIFLSPEARLDLNRIIHPKVIKKIEKLSQRANGLLFIDIPLLYEAQLEYLVDKVLVVYTNPETQLSRLMKRDNIDEGYAKMKIASQMSIEEKKLRANYLVNNELGLEETYEQIERILRRIENEI
jgi:dephospho-CoA kinase